MDDEFAKLIKRINPPRVVIDNDSCDDATIIKVDNVKKHGTLTSYCPNSNRHEPGDYKRLYFFRRRMVHGRFSKNRSYICFCLAFVTVFNVVDSDGEKIIDEEIISNIQKKLESNDDSSPSSKGMVGMVPFEEYNCIELTGADRPGLLSEVCAVLTDLHCNAVSAELWTQKARAAAVFHITDDSTNRAIGDAKRLSTIKELLCNVLRANYGTKAAKLTLLPPGFFHRERRLHQMLADHNFENVDGSKGGLAVQEENSQPLVTVADRTEKGYKVITVRSKDRPKLLFDTICTLTDMHYVVFHGAVGIGTEEAYQEYYVRCVDGVTVQSDVERERIAQCLEAAIKRRSWEGLELELCAKDRIGLLSSITRILGENGLYIKRAEICTKGGKARHIFYVTDVSGDDVDPQIVESIRQQIGEDILHVRWNSRCMEKQPQQEKSIGFSLGNLLWNRAFPSFLVRPYS